MGKYKKMFEELLDIDERFPDDMKDGLRFLYDGYHRKGGYEWEDPKVGYQVTVPKHLQHTALEDTGVFFGTQWVTEDKDGTVVESKKYIGKSPDRDGHVLVVGGAGSGKSSCIAIPTLGTWGGTFFAIDIKGELSRNQEVIAKSKYPTKYFSFTTDDGFFRYDPFYLLREGDQNDLVQNAREIAQAIIPILPDNRDPFWSMAAQHVLTAVLLYVCGEPGKENKVEQLSFNHAMTMIQTEPIWEVIDVISSSKNEIAKMHINQFKDIKCSEDNKMLTGISAELSNKVMVFATDNRIKSAFSESDNMLRWEDLEDHNIFMSIPEDKLGQWDGAITLMLTQLIRTLERRADKYDTSPGAKKLPPVLLLLDEFPRLGKMDVIQNAVSTLRSKGVTICLIMQSLAQLDKTYGVHTRQIIMDNCPYKAILNVTDPEYQRIFSEMAGRALFTRPSRSYSQSLGDGWSSSKSRVDNEVEATTKSKGDSGSSSVNIGTSLSLEAAPIILPHEMATLKDILLLTPEGFCHVDKEPYYRFDPKLGMRVEPDNSLSYHH